MARSTTIAAAIFGMAAGLVVASGGAQARVRHHYRHSAARKPAPYVEEATGSRTPDKIPYRYSYYPNDIEGGVAGNGPFNNQIRKFVDPLNANGGR